MGACDFTSASIGKTPWEAFNRAVEDAYYEYGHSAYSGSICEKSGFIPFTIPPRLSLEKLMGWISEYEFAGDGTYSKQDLEWEKKNVLTAKPGTKRAAQKRVRVVEQRIKEQDKRVAKFKREVGPHLGLVRRMSEVFNDKWGPACCVEITSPTQKKQWAQHALSSNGGLKRGEHVYVFFGMASS